MRLPLEAYLLVVRHTESLADLRTLACTSRTLQRAAERALYQELTITASTVFSLNHALSNPRLATLVETLTISASPSPTHDDDASDASVTSPVPDGYWDAVATILSRTSRLRRLSVLVDGDAAHTWILRQAVFKLAAFHCDLTWDADLVTFLNAQNELTDLYISDYASYPTSVPDAMDTDTLSLAPTALPALSVLECSFIDAVAALTPGRPVVRVKTCFSHEDTEGKENELRTLSGALQQSTKRVVSLDLADASYSEDFTLTVLDGLAHHLPRLRYFGTLVLPIGLERLQFFGFLMRLHDLYAVELEITDWDPPPSPAGMRALASELRLYCPSIQVFVFVLDFERTLIRVKNGYCTVELNPAMNIDSVWRDIPLQ